VQHRDECHAFVERAVREIGRLDILVNNAAYQQKVESILEIAEEQLDGTFRTSILQLKRDHAWITVFKSGQALQT